MILIRCQEESCGWDIYVYLLLVWLIYFRCHFSRIFHCNLSWSKIVRIVIVRQNYLYIECSTLTFILYILKRSTFNKRRPLKKLIKYYYKKHTCKWDGKIKVLVTNQPYITWIKTTVHNKCSFQERGRGSRIFVKGTFNNMTRSPLPADHYSACSSQWKRAFMRFY